MEKKKRPSKSRAAKNAPRKAVKTPRESGFRSAVGLYIALVVAGFFLIWLFRNGLPGDKPTPAAVRSTPAVIAPASSPAPVRRVPQAIPVPAPQPQPAALTAEAPVREFWSWRYDEGITGLSKSGLQSLQEVAAVLRDNPRLTARVQVGAASSTTQAGAMAAERAALVARTLQEQGVSPNRVTVDTQAEGEPRQGSVTLESR
ncbi:MAG TPA: OmpA family protein [bacterium]|nr:OmpA family protein [bacterium]